MFQGLQIEPLPLGHKCFNRLPEYDIAEEETIEVFILRDTSVELGAIAHSY